MSCGMGLIKYLLFIFNFIFALCGLAILVIGALVHIESASYKDAVKDTLLIPAVILIIIGSIVFIIAFFGCCGAIRESHCMTITFASFLLTILIVQVALAIFVFVGFQKTKIDMEKPYMEIFKNYYSSDTERFIVNNIQQNFDCCGVKSYRDFYSLNQNNTIPWSCCNDIDANRNCPQEDVYQTGCATKITELTIKTAKVIGGVVLGTAGVELIGIIFALCLANSIKNIERRGYRV